MARVFVSHASDDRVLAGELYGWLVQAGHEVFLDQNLRDGLAVGEEWEQRLHERLRWADAVVCVLTSAYVSSQWCTAEVAIARSRGSRLLPVRAEPAVSHGLLRSVQHTDLTQDPAVARDALVQALRRVDPAGGAGWPDDRSPFPGLRPFDLDWHRVFFGRQDDVEQLAELLRSPAEQARGAALLVVGPSGCGKSSLVRAGLVPTMATEPGWWTLPPITPGADPVAALARELAAEAHRLGLDWTLAHVGDRLRYAGLTELANDLLLAAPEGARRHLLIVVDQAEELLTPGTADSRAEFARLVGPALPGPVRLVATLRSEFLDQLQAEALHGVATHTYSLAPLGREALRAVIDGPARLAGLTLDEQLVAQLVDDTGSGEALPLLAFTLAQLAEGVGRGAHLSSRRYDQLGRVQGALTHQAEAALADALAVNGRHRDQVIAALLRLVTVDDHGRPTRWRARRDELPAAVVADLDHFVARRLLSTDTDNGSVVVEVGHEALLSAWPPLAQAITDNATALRARRRIEPAAGSSPPPPSGRPITAHPPGCGPAANSPPPSPTPAPASTPPVGPPQPTHPAQ
ncbi:MAG: toll/interleukin-1 receptor domain-containing protein [Sciscionella sp.]